MEEQTRIAEDIGIAGTSILTNSSAFVTAMELLEGGGDMTQITENFRQLRTQQRWTVTPPEVAAEQFLARFTTGPSDPMRQVVTPDWVRAMRSEWRSENPAEAGFMEGPDKVQLRFDDVLNIRNEDEFVSFALGEGLVFPADKPARDYVVFNQEEGTRGPKVVATVMGNARAVSMVKGSPPARLEGRTFTVRVFTPNAMRKGLVHKLEGPTTRWVKKMMLLGAQPQEVLWQITYCLMTHGLRVRAVYPDDEGVQRRNVTLYSDDFQLRVEYFNAREASIAAALFTSVIATQSPKVFEGKKVHTAKLKAEFSLKGPPERPLQETHPLRLEVALPQGHGAQLRQLVEDSMGSASVAAFSSFLESFFLNEFPMVYHGKITPNVYDGGSVVNFGYVSFNFRKNEMKALLELYTRHVTRSAAHAERRVDWTCREAAEPFNDLRCKVYSSGRWIRKYPEVGEKDDSAQRTERERRGFESDPIGYFQAVWGSGMSASPAEMIYRRRQRALEEGLRPQAAPMGATCPGSRRMTQGKSVDIDSLKEDELEYACYISAKPVLPHFWRQAPVYKPPADREGGGNRNPFELAVDWHDVLYDVSPELILPPEWAHIPYKEGEEEAEKRLSEELLESLKEVSDTWVPSPASNCLPVHPRTVPGPTGDLEGKDLRLKWGGKKWETDPVQVYRCIAALIWDGSLVQTRHSSGLLLEKGPRIKHGLAAPDLKNPGAFGRGAGTSLEDPDSISYAHKLAETIQANGVVLVEANRYGGLIFPPYMVEFGGEMSEHVFSREHHSHLRYEDGHFAFIASYVLAGGDVTQIASPGAGGVFLLSKAEEERRKAAGVADRDYVPESRLERARRLRTDAGGQGEDGNNPDTAMEGAAGGQNTMDALAVALKEKARTLHADGSAEQDMSFGVAQEALRLAGDLTVPQLSEVTASVLRDAGVSENLLRTIPAVVKTGSEMKILAASVEGDLKNARGEGLDKHGALVRAVEATLKGAWSLSKAELEAVLREVIEANEGTEEDVNTAVEIMGRVGAAVSAGGRPEDGSAPGQEERTVEEVRGAPSRGGAEDWTEAAGGEAESDALPTPIDRAPGQSLFRAAAETAARGAMAAGMAVQGVVGATVEAAFNALHLLQGSEISLAPPELGAALEAAGIEDAVWTVARDALSEEIAKASNLEEAIYQSAYELKQRGGREDEVAVRAVETARQLGQGVRPTLLARATQGAALRLHVSPEIAKEAGETVFEPATTAGEGEEEQSKRLTKESKKERAERRKQETMNRGMSLRTNPSKPTSSGRGGAK